jgi:hypothetical protein
MPVRVARDVPAKHVFLSSILNGISRKLEAWDLRDKTWAIRNLLTPQVSPLKPVSGPSVQPGVDAALSRRRSPVQIRYGSLESNGVVRQWLSGLS